MVWERKTAERNNDKMSLMKKQQPQAAAGQPHAPRFMTGPTGLLLGCVMAGLVGQSAACLHPPHLLLSDPGASRPPPGPSPPSLMHMRHRRRQLAYAYGTV